MPVMKKILILFFLLPCLLKAQPFIDIANINAQVFKINYKDSLSTKSLLTNYNATLFFPKKFANDNMLLFRLTGEMLEFGTKEPYTDLYAFSAQAGFQFVTKNKKWKAGFIAMPKLSSDLIDHFSSKDFQYGGTVLFTYVANDTTLKIKFGLYYNRECFGNFFVPLAGIDWKLNERFSIYGLLPNNMRVEYKVCKKLYAGIAYKNYQRSYRLNAYWRNLNYNDDFVRVRESQAKLFFDFYAFNHAVLFADFAYTLKYSFVQHDDVNTREVHPSAVYAPMENNFLFTVGLAYRMRLD